MIIERLRICDFGVFRAEHVIELAPRKKYGAKRPIILFGGLNGSGKTTILTAVRLALYGKQALGRATSQKQYDDYLRESIHRNSSSLVNPDSASIALDFQYSNLGELSHYQVVRSWTTPGKLLKETLTIARDGKALPEVSPEQCQGFLNELVPIGVSDLFFFDGEKIAELAEEEGNAALGDAIKRLLGLDLIERLGSDLNVYLRRQRTANLPEDTRLKLEQFEAQFTELENKRNDELVEIGAISDEIKWRETQLSKLEDTLTSKGGAWASQRETLKVRQQVLEHERNEVESQLREAVADLYPVSLAPALLEKLRAQLENEASLHQWELAAEILRNQEPQLTGALNKILPDALHAKAADTVRRVLADLAKTPKHLKKVRVLHDLAKSSHQQVIAWIDEALHKTRGFVEELKNKLEAIETELAQVSLQLDRAPDVDTIKIDLEAIRQENAAIAALRGKVTSHTGNAKKYAWEAIELNRTMSDLQEGLRNASQTTTALGLASATRELLKEFSDELKNRKLHQLEKEFEKAFAQLARKKDILAGASIDPHTFDVSLIGRNNNLIQKKQLSAGEKQIYAIAMLQALARTSGRKLPMIIDTPLGRLDSHHRNKLVQHYFPAASHQVIILSTDTEVDKHFYNELAPHISHAFHIMYDKNEGGSDMTEGYFWKTNEEALSDVS